MQDLIRKPDWIPLYIQRIKASDSWGLDDYQFGWYMKLLIALADSDVPGYLVNDVRTLWRVAGARTEKFFRERGGMELVARYFSRTDDGLHIYNERMLEVLHEQMKKLTRRRKATTVSLSFSLSSVPDFINQELFSKFLAMRESIKKPMSPEAIELAFRKLERMHNAGQDVNEVIEQSIMNSWQGFFPVKREGVSHGNGIAISTKAERRNADISEATREVFSIHRNGNGNVPKGLSDKTSDR